MCWQVQFLQNKLILLIMVWAHMKSLKIHCLVHTSRVRMSMRCCPNAVLFPSMLRCYLKLNEYSKGLTFTLIMPNNTFESQSKNEQEWYVELLQKLQYVILQQQEELALGLFNRCRHWPSKIPQGTLMAYFFSIWRGLQGMLLYVDKTKAKKNVTAVARLLQPTMAL